MLSEKGNILILAMISLFVFSGCSIPKYTSKTSPDNLKLPPANLPAYIPGEYFSYDSGASMMVTNMNAEKVTWRFGTHRTSVAQKNFLYPAISTESKSSRRETAVGLIKGDVWPLQIGKTASFATTQTKRTHLGVTGEFVERSTTCRVEGTERVSVPADTYDTYVILCNRYSVADGGWRGSRRYYYSPDIGHYVKVEKSYSSRPKKVERLMKYGFSSKYLTASEQKNLEKKLVETLNKKPDGAADTWFSRSGRITAVLVPLRSYSGQFGKKCRKYRSIYTVEGRVSQNSRDMCREQNGSWKRTR